MLTSDTSGYIKNKMGYAKQVGVYPTPLLTAHIQAQYRCNVYTQCIIIIIIKYDC